MKRSGLQKVRNGFELFWRVKVQGDSRNMYFKGKKSTKLTLMTGYYSILSIAKLIQFQKLHSRDLEIEPEYEIRRSKL